MSLCQQHFQDSYHYFAACLVIINKGGQALPVKSRCTSKFWR